VTPNQVVHEIDPHYGGVVNAENVAAFVTEFIVLNVVFEESQTRGCGWAVHGCATVRPNASGAIANRKRFNDSRLSLLLQISKTSSRR
jgi:hypothetical protein